MKENIFVYMAKDEFEVLTFTNEFCILIIRQVFEELLPHHMIDDLFPEVWRQVNDHK